VAQSGKPRTLTALLLEGIALRHQIAVLERCAYSKLNPDVLMMKPAEDWYRCDAAELLRPAKIRSIFIQ
jgi:hypothetical protein